MSDDTGGPALEPIGGRDDDATGTLEGVHRTLSTLGMRIDALVTSTTSYRSAITDRLSEYGELVTKLTRAQAADLEEYRHATERTMSELRRGVGASEETLERVAARIDSMLSDTDAADDQSRRMLAEVRSILDSQENLGRFLTEALDQFGEQMAERMVASQQVIDQQLDAIRTSLTAEDGADLRSLVGVVHERLLEVASGEVVGALWDEVRGVRDAVEAGSSAELRAEVIALTDAVRDLLDGAEMVDEAEAGAALDGVVVEMARLRADLAEGLVIDAETPAEDPGVAALRAEVGELNVALRQLLAQAEVVEEDEPEPVASVIPAVLEQVNAQLTVVQAKVDALAEQAGASRQIQASLDELIERTMDVPDASPVAVVAPVAAGPDPVVEELVAMTAEVRGMLDALGTESRTIGAGVDAVMARLDEGLELAEDVTAAAPVVASDPELADHLAAMRDDVAAEFDALRQLIRSSAPAPAPTTAPAAAATVVDLAPVTELLEFLRDDIAELPHRVEGVLPAPVAPPRAAPVPKYATIDPDTIDVLRAEIRASASSPEQVSESLRTELAALRRRIKLRAEGEVLSDAQLTLIAEAVAERLGR